MGESSLLGRFHFHFAALVDVIGADQHHSMRSADMGHACGFMDAVKMCISIAKSE